MTLSSSYRTIGRETLVDRDRQLTMLHQEILIKRDSLLRTSEICIPRSARSLASTRNSTANLSATEASVRNARLLKDMDTLQQNIHERLNSMPSPRFVTLQNNYWSMVRSLLPLWEQSLPRKYSKY